MLARTAFIAALVLSPSLVFAQASTKIGFIATLSGPAAQLGIDSVDGFKLAIENGKLGNVPVEIEVVDDQLKPEIGLEQAKRLVERDKPAILIGTTFSNVLMAIAPMVTRANVILISQNAGPSPLAGAQCNPNFFAVAFQNDQIYEPVGAYLQKKGAKKAVVLAPNYQAGRDAIAGFKHTFKG
jgi:branched-chain amino acid transport system substrate-binding protein